MATDDNSGARTEIDVLSAVLFATITKVFELVGTFGEDSRKLDAQLESLGFNDATRKAIRSAAMSDQREAVAEFFASVVRAISCFGVGAEAGQLASVAVGERKDQSASNLIMATVARHISEQICQMASLVEAVRLRDSATYGRGGS